MLCTLTICCECEHFKRLHVFRDLCPENGAPVGAVYAPAGDAGAPGKGNIQNRSHRHFCVDVRFLSGLHLSDTPHQVGSRLPFQVCI